MNWSEVFLKLGFFTPPRKDVEREIKESGNEVNDITLLEGLFLLRRKWDDQHERLGSPDTFDSRDFPEIIDRDIRDLCSKINSLDYVKTTNCCSGHRTHASSTSGPRTDFSNHETIKYCLGYSIPSLAIIYDVNDSRSSNFLKHILRSLDALKQIPGVFITIQTDNGYHYRTNQGQDVFVKFHQDDFWVRELVIHAYIYPLKLEVKRVEIGDEKFINYWIDELIVGHYYRFATSKKTKEVKSLFFNCFYEALKQVNPI